MNAMVVRTLVGGNESDGNFSETLYGLPSKANLASEISLPAK